MQDVPEHEDAVTTRSAFQRVLLALPLVALLLSLGTFACHTEGGGSGSGSRTSMVAVASYANPSMTVAGQGAHEALTEALDRAGIPSVAAGSAGYTLNVYAMHADRAREIVEATIDEQDLAAELVEE